MAELERQIEAGMAAIDTPHDSSRDNRLRGAIMDSGNGRPEGQKCTWQALVSCSHDPVTGFSPDGCCHAGPQDQMHTVCAIMTDEFRLSKKAGNDLSTPMPQFGFPGCAMVINGVVRRAGNRRVPCAPGAAYRHQHRDPAYLFA